jgi:glucose-6-phosphate 1-dehydrogenase
VVEHPSISVLLDGPEAEDFRPLETDATFDELQQVRRRIMGAVIEAKPLSTTTSPLPQGECCVVVIFGASGDLTQRKLMPALYNLECFGCMHPKADVLGLGRTDLSTETFRGRMKEAVAHSDDAKKFDEDRWSCFAKRMSYLSGDLNDNAFFEKLRDRLEKMRTAGASGNHLFYFATPPSLALSIIDGLQTAGLNHNEHGWSRIILEKPFGHDLRSAREINSTVLRVFREEDVYRIDHFLGKETVQNMLVFRFANSVFEPVWNRNFIDYVEILAAETLGVERRAAFYEETGALRDMVASHLLQLLAITAMEPPIAFDADAVREQKVQIFRSIYPMTPDEVAQRTVRGQYGPGDFNGQSVPGYREEPGVAPSSSVETYVALELHLENWRWAGVPFFVRTGKRLAADVTEVRVHFKRTPQALFAGRSESKVDPNVVILRIQPDEGIMLRFSAKRPGQKIDVVPVQAEFNYRTAFNVKSPVAYETLLLDAMRGDATLFTRGDEIEAQWRIITPIEEAWAQQQVPHFPNYAAGSQGPEIAEAWIRNQLRGWQKMEAANSWFT